MPARKLLPFLVCCAAIAPTGCSPFGDDRVTVPPTGTVAEPPQRPDRPPPAKLFAADSFWNARLAADVPVDAQSAPLVRELVGMVDQAASERRGPWLGAKQGTTPIYEVPADQPPVRVELENGDAPARRSLSRALSAVPIPRHARPAPGNDAHLTIWQPSKDRLWELFQARRDADGRWTARWGGAIRDVSDSPGYYSERAWPGATTYWGATATSLPIAAGRIRPAELRAKRIDHALGLNLPEIRAGEFAWPAQRSDGENTEPAAIPEGARFRLPADLDVDSLDLPPVVAMIARAAQRYGLVVQDRSTTVSLYAEHVPGTRDPYQELIGPEYPSNVNVLMEQFPWERLELLKDVALQRRRAACAARSPARVRGVPAVSRPDLEIGYVVSLYPAVAHAFVAREVRALKADGARDRDVLDPPQLAGRRPQQGRPSRPRGDLRRAAAQAAGLRGRPPSALRRRARGLRADPDPRPATARRPAPGKALAALPLPRGRADRRPVPAPWHPPRARPLHQPLG